MRERCLAGASRTAQGSMVTRSKTGDGRRYSGADACNQQNSPSTYENCAWPPAGGGYSSPATVGRLKTSWRLRQRTSRDRRLAIPSPDRPTPVLPSSDGSQQLSGASGARRGASLRGVCDGIVGSSHVGGTPRQKCGLTVTVEMRSSAVCRTRPTFLVWQLLTRFTSFQCDKMHSLGVPPISYIKALDTAREW